MTFEKQKSILVLGGTRSGKTAYALKIALDSGLKPLMLATTEVQDAEMRLRVDAHKRERGPEWALVEETLELAAAIIANSSPAHIVVVDCLTLWLSNVMMADRDIEQQSGILAAAVSSLAGPVVFVSNELGHGTVPTHALTRKFRDAQGKLNQMMAAACDSVIYVQAGLPQMLKPAAPILFNF